MSLKVNLNTNLIHKFLLVTWLVTTLHSSKNIEKTNPQSQSWAKTDNAVFNYIFLPTLCPFLTYYFFVFVWDLMLDFLSNYNFIHEK